MVWFIVCALMIMVAVAAMYISKRGRRAWACRYYLQYNGRPVPTKMRLVSYLWCSMNKTTSNTLSWWDRLVRAIKYKVWLAKWAVKSCPRKLKNQIMYTYARGAIEVRAFWAKLTVMHQALIPMRLHNSWCNCRRCRHYHDEQMDKCYNWNPEWNSEIAYPSTEEEEEPFQMDESDFFWKYEEDEYWDRRIDEIKREQELEKLLAKEAAERRKAELFDPTDVVVLPTIKVTPKQDRQQDHVEWHGRSINAKDPHSNQWRRKNGRRERRALKRQMQTLTQEET